MGFLRVSDKELHGLCVLVIYKDLCMGFLCVSDKRYLYDVSD